MVVVCRWKQHEAVMLAMGSVRPLILESVTKQKVDYDLVAFLQTVVLADLNQNGTTLLAVSLKYSNN